MQMISVSSSNLAAVGYDPSDSTLVVEFKNGTTYKYRQVPQSIFDGLMRASSKGAFFNAKIKDHYRHTRL